MAGLKAGWLLFLKGALVVLCGIFFSFGINSMLSAELAGVIEPLRFGAEKKNEAEGADEESLGALEYNRNLFNQDDEGPTFPDSEVEGQALKASESEGQASEEGIPESDLDLSLVGTMVAEDSRWSVAHLRGGSGEDFYVHPGEFVAGVSVVQVRRTFVVVRRDDQAGELELIALNGVDASTAQAALARQNERQERAQRAGSHEVTSNETEEAPVELNAALNKDLIGGTPFVKLEEGDLVTNGDSLIVSRDFIERQATFASELADGLVLAPLADADGMVGFRLGEVPKGSFFDGAGLEPGDVIVGVNGRRVQDEVSALHFVEDLASKGETVIEVDRRGEREKIHLRAE